MPDQLSPDICVIGAGPGGLAVAMGAAKHGVSVVLVEKGAIGGAQLARGGVPAQALYAAARLRDDLARGGAMGIRAAGLEVDPVRVAAHVRAARDAAARNLTAERLAVHGITVVRAAARFADGRTVTAGGTAIRARRFVIATGALPTPPDVPGLAAAAHGTAAAAFEIDRPPARLVVFGADGDGLAVAQAYQRLGIGATVVDSAPALPGADPELAAFVLSRLRAEGVAVHDGLPIDRVEREGDGVRVRTARGDIVVAGARLLVLRGRAPAVDGLGIEAAGIEAGPDGIAVDRHLRTANPRVYAIGDVTPGLPLAARAEHQAGLVLATILFRLPRRDRPEVVPSVARTDPALAEVGLAEAGARARRGTVRVLRLPFGESDAARAEAAAAGLVKVVTDGRGRVIGAGAVGAGALDMIAPWTLAVARGLDVATMASLALPQPSRGDLSRRVAARFDGPGPAAPWRRRLIAFLGKFG